MLKSGLPALAIIMITVGFGAPNSFAAPDRRIDDTAPVILKFPADFSLGGVTRIIEMDPRWDPRVKRSGIARGTIRFPPGTKIRLEINYACGQKPELLEHLGSEVVSIDARDLDNFSDTTLSYIGKLSQLIEVKLDNTDATDAGMKFLRPLKNLLIFTANRTLITGAAMSDIGKLSSLERLELAGTRLNDASMGKMEALTGIHLLVLTQSGIGDEGVSHLQALRNLERLWINENPRITDKGLSYLVRLPHLHDLDLTGTGVTANSVKYLVQCKSLKHLDLDFGKYSPTDMAKLHAALPGCSFRIHEPKLPTEIFSPLH